MWEGTVIALEKAAMEKKQNKKTPDVQQDKVPVLAWESNNHPAPQSLYFRHRGQRVRSVQRLKYLIKRDLESEGSRRKMSPLVPASLLKGS